jgi:carboxylesterase
MEPVGANGHIAYHAMPTESMESVVVAARRFAPNIPKVQCPTLILHSVHDATSDFAGSKMLIEKLGTEDKTLVAFNRGNHVITLDYPREKLESTALDWLTRRAGTNAPR